METKFVRGQVLELEGSAAPLYSKQGANHLDCFESGAFQGKTS